MHPFEVGVEGADQGVSRLLEIIAVATENPVQLRQRFVHRVGLEVAGDERDHALVLRRGVLDFTPADLRRN